MLVVSKSFFGRDFKGSSRVFFFLQRTAFRARPVARWKEGVPHHPHGAALQDGEVDASLPPLGRP